MDYSKLKEVIADWSNRQDLAEQIPVFIEMTEARLKRDLRDKVRMAQRAEAMVYGEYFPLPCDWCETIKVIADGSVLRLADSFNIERVELYSGPKYYRHSGDQLQLLPATDVSESDPIRFEMEYLALPEALSEENPSNWVLETYPDLYIYGALMQVAPFLQDDARLPIWSQAYGEAVSAANVSSVKSSGSGSALRLQRHGIA
jgi:hypothetical protein